MILPSPRNLPVVAIIGRANVGKSTLFNTLIEEQRAVVSSEAGTTRDRNIALCHWQGNAFDLVDTAGLDLGLTDELERFILLQTNLAVEKADLVLFVVNVKEEVTLLDRQTIARLKKVKKPFILVINKVDGPRDQKNVAEFYALGAEDTIPVSATSGAGTGNLLDAVVRRLSQVTTLAPTPLVPEATIRVAIIGRPNVGKSSLINKFLREERAIVSSLPHTTRDAIDILLDHKGTPLRIVDTAGLRRKGKMTGEIEFFSTLRTHASLKKADVVLFVLDASEAPSKQDQHIAALLNEGHKSVILVINKWDLIEKDERSAQEYYAILQQKMSFLHWAPIIFVSGKTGQRTDNVLDLVVEYYNKQEMRIPQEDLDRFLLHMLKKRQPWCKTMPLQEERRIKLTNMRQTDVRPPRFEIDASGELHPSYIRFLENSMRDSFDLKGVPFILNILIL